MFSSDVSWRLINPQAQTHSQIHHARTTPSKCRSFRLCCLRLEFNPFVYSLGDSQHKKFSVWTSDKTVTWDQAAANCHKMGAELATIANKEENDKVQALAKSLENGRRRCQDHVWIGLKSSATSPGRTEGTWFWQDGTPLTFQNWAWTQQDGGGRPPICGGMYPWGNINGAPGTWLDHKCSTRTRWCYACQKKQTGGVYTSLPNRN